MTKHIATAVFFLCLTAIVLNTSLWGSAWIYLGGIGIGTVAIAFVHFSEKKAKAAEAPEDKAAELERWRKELARRQDDLADAKAKGADDRVAFLEPRVDEARRMLAKLGA